MLDKLVRTQCYGLSTRLLSVTSNPLNALYFCCAGLRVDNDGNEIDGKVIVLSTKSSEVRFFDADTVSCIAKLALMAESEKDALDTGMEAGAFNGTDECKKLLHFIRSEKPHLVSEVPVAP